MANRLKVYCRRTILDSAKEGAWPAKRRTAASTRTAFMDAMRGTDTGWWHDLIYTAPMLDMAHRYRHDIATAYAEYTDATGEQLQARAEEFNQADIYAALLRKYSFADYKGDNGDAKARLAEAKLWGLRFAVEWFAGELARDFCPDL